MSIKKGIPNAITCCNLLCGCLAVLYSFEFKFNTAFLFIIGGAVFDFLDGLSARVLKAYSAIGKELDSLADIITFGVAPAFLAYNFFLYISNFESVIFCKPFRFIPFILVVFSALRLAKFNIDNNQSENFIGLATPACSLLISSLVVGFNYIIDIDLTYILYLKWLMLALILLLSFLLVSNIPMFSLKLKSTSFKENKVRYIFCGIVLLEIMLCLIIKLHYSHLISIILLSYILYNMILYIVNLCPARGSNPGPQH